MKGEHFKDEGSERVAAGRQEGGGDRQTVKRKTVKDHKRPRSVELGGAGHTEKKEITRIGRKKARLVHPRLNRKRCSSKKEIET